MLLLLLARACTLCGCVTGAAADQDLHVHNHVLTGCVETFSNSTTLPPLSPVARYEPSPSNSTAEITSAASQYTQKQRWRSQACNWAPGWVWPRPGEEAGLQKQEDVPKRSDQLHHRDLRALLRTPWDARMCMDASPERALASWPICCLTSRFFARSRLTVLDFLAGCALSKALQELPFHRRSLLCTLQSPNHLLLETSYRLLILGSARAFGCDKT